MGNNIFIVTFLRFILLVLLQVFLFNNINLGGYINPYVYLLFILLFPLDGNRTILIFLSFFLGLSIDIFEDSGGVHAAASVFAAYMRLFVMKYSFGVSYEYNISKLEKTSMSEKITYISSIVLLHHIVLFSLEFFNFNHLLLLIKSIIFSSVFTFAVVLSIIILFSRQES